MEQRLNRAGITTVAELWQASPLQLRRVWGGINGLLFHQMLHGVDIQPPSSRFAKTIGHQHVLEPQLRSTEGARNFARHLLAKAAERLRRGDYYCRRLGVLVSWVGDLGGWWDEVSFHETRDTGFLLDRLEQLWHRVPHYKPLSVSRRRAARSRAGRPTSARPLRASQAPETFAVDRSHQRPLRPRRDRLWFVPAHDPGLPRPRCISTGAGEMGVLAGDGLSHKQFRFKFLAFSRSQNRNRARRG
jgi:DNA polymerase-4